MLFTGHKDAFNTFPMANMIIGINSGVPAVSGVAFPVVGNYANLIILKTYFSEMLFPTVIGFSLIF
jgi:hypothetical protein